MLVVMWHYPRIQPATDALWHSTASELILEWGGRRGEARRAESQGRNHGWKVEGPRFASQHQGACARRPTKGRAGGGCVRGSPPPAVGPGVLPPEFFLENSDAKSCNLVASALISGLPRTCISEQAKSMSRAKSVPKFQLFSRGCASGC